MPNNRDLAIPRFRDRRSREADTPQVAFAVNMIARIKNRARREFLEFLEFPGKTKLDGRRPVS